jgi:superfamily II DNA or RNA helicase
MQILSSTAVNGSAKKLYPYQLFAIETLFEKMQAGADQLRLLFQLPTGGGKTVIFSEIADRFIKQ